MLARERREAAIQHRVAGVHVQRRRDILGEAEIVADFGKLVRLDAALAKGVQERLLHLEHAFGGKDDGVLRRPVDVVVDLRKFASELPMVVCLEIDEAGVVFAGCDSVELREADVG